MRTKARRDQNEPGIVKGLRAYGIGVYRVNDTGLPDLLCWRGDCIRLIEVKTQKGQFTVAQQRYVGPRWVVKTLEEALACFGDREIPDFQNERTSS